MSRLLKVALVVFAVSMPALGWAQGKIAVVDVQGAILQTDIAQKTIEEVRGQKDYKADKAEYEQLKSEGEELLKKFQKDAAVMSKEQQINAQQKLSTKQADLDHVTGKLQQAEQAAVQGLLREMAPKVQTVLREMIADEGIGLLLQQQAVIHADAGYNLTAKVTDKLNQLSTK